MSKSSRISGARINYITEYCIRLADVYIFQLTLKLATLYTDSLLLTIRSRLRHVNKHDKIYVYETVELVVQFFPRQTR